jgi:hypothetical protein
MVRSMCQLDQEEFDAWLEGDIDLAPFFSPLFETVSKHRDAFLRELHQISPAEVYDRFSKEDHGLKVEDGVKAVLRIGKELQMMKGIVQSL